MRKIICLGIAVFVFTQLLFSQLSVSGPLCVTTGTVYQYLVTGKFDSSSNLRVCINGGKLSDLVNTCAKGMLSQVKVIWDQNATNGSISLSSSVGNATLNVVITSELNGGSVGTTTKTQLTGQDSIPEGIQCSAANGGGCNPVYDYQWQQSNDQANWKDIKNETEQNLKFSVGVNMPVYYRRKVTELKSGTIKYSDIASVYVIPKPTRKL